MDISGPSKAWTSHFSVVMKGDSSPRDRCPNQCSLLQRTRHRFLRGTHDRRRFMARLCRMADRSFPAGFLWVSILILDLFPDGKSMEIHYVENLGNQEFFFWGGSLSKSQSLCTWSLRRVFHGVQTQLASNNSSNIWHSFAGGPVGLRIHS